jgi:hypothetical protein
MIDEGTHGEPALDLVGRQLPHHGGRAIQAFLAEIDALVAENASADAALMPHFDGLALAKGRLQEATLWLLQNGPSNPDNAGAASADYLNLMAITSLAYMWAKIVKAAQPKAEGDAFYADKLKTGRYFLDRILPETAMHLEKLKTGAASMMALEAEVF